VVAGGKLIVKDKKCTNLDESALANEAKSKQEKLLEATGLNPSSYWPVTTY